MQISSSSNGASRSKRWLTLTLRSTFSTWLHGLRQMFLDGDSLVHQANREHRLKLAFVVGEFRSAPDGWVTIASLEDGLDPDTRPPGSPSDAAGRVHRTNSPKGAAQKIAEFSAGFGIGGLPAAIRQLKAIARVALRGLRRLIAAAQKG